MGFTVNAIVCEGHRGLLGFYGAISLQMCQFHPASIIRRDITKKPKSEASKELMSLVFLMSKTDKESLIGTLDDYSKKWRNILKEHSTSPLTGKSHYTHKRLRSAYRSLKTNKEWLFIWYDSPDLNIPNTTNALGDISLISKPNLGITMNYLSDEKTIYK